MTLLLVETLKEVINIMTAVGGIGAAIGIGIYAFKNSGAKDLKKNVDDIATNVSTINHNINENKNELYEIRKTILTSDANNIEDHKKIFEHIDKTSEVISNIVIKCNLDKAMDDIIANAQVFTENDTIMAAFFELCGRSVKRTAYDIIKNSIDKVTKEEILAKVEYMRFEVRDFYGQFEDDFVIIIRPYLISLIQQYQTALLEIKNDVINDKNMRVKLASINLLQHTFSFMVQERIKYKPKHK